MTKFLADENFSPTKHDPEKLLAAKTSFESKLVENSQKLAENIMLNSQH